jgi:hypothetical protein
MGRYGSPATASHTARVPATANLVAALVYIAQQGQHRATHRGHLDEPAYTGQIIYYRHHPRPVPRDSRLPLQPIPGRSSHPLRRSPSTATPVRASLGPGRAAGHGDARRALCHGIPRCCGESSSRIPGSALDGAGALWLTPEHSGSDSTVPRFCWSEGPPTRKVTSSIGDHTRNNPTQASGVASRSRKWCRVSLSAATPATPPATNDQKTAATT